MNGGGKSEDKKSGSSHAAVGHVYISASLILTIDTENVSRTVGDGIFGINHRYAFNGYGSFDSETIQMREEFAELYNEAGFGARLCLCACPRRCG